MSKISKLVKFLTLQYSKFWHFLFYFVCFQYNNILLFSIFPFFFDIFDTRDKSLTFLHTSFSNVWFFIFLHTYIFHLILLTFVTSFSKFFTLFHFFYIWHLRHFWYLQINNIFNIFGDFQFQNLWNLTFDILMLILLIVLIFLYLTSDIMTLEKSVFSKLPIF